MRRVALWGLVVLVVLGLVAVTGIGWYYSGEILLVEPEEDPVYDTEVVAVDGGAVVLEDSADARRPGIWGLDFPDGYAQVGDVDGVEQEGVRRPLTAIDGVPDAGDEVRLDRYAYPPDPERAGFDFTVSSVDIAAPLGTQPAWYVDRADERWAIFVHGRAGGRHDCFRLLPLFTSLDFSSLCISYRNDPDTNSDPDGLYRQGDTEWTDVEAAVQHALGEGAETLVLVGFSMGGQITANFLRRSALAGEVDAAVWDAPLLDWGPTLEAGARDRDVPTVIVPLGMAASELRADVDYEELNQIANADEFSQPILLFHGTADATVPVSVSDRFAQARPDLVTYERVDDAGHLQAWNVDPPRFETAVRTFLADHAP
jgi:hypothetical protein